MSRRPLEALSEGDLRLAATSLEAEAVRFPDSLHSERCRSVAVKLRRCAELAALEASATPPKHCGFCQSAPCVCPPSADMELGEGLPSELYRELMACAQAKAVNLSWLCNIYRRGVEASATPRPEGERP